MEGFLGLALNVILTIYLIIDSRKHDKNPILWGILGFILGPVALGIYLIKTDRKLIGWIIAIIGIIGYTIALISGAFLLSIAIFL